MLVSTRRARPVYHVCGWGARASGADGRYWFRMRTLAVTLLLLLTGPSARGQLVDEVPLEDLLQVLVLDRQLVAVDARSGGQRSLPLRLHEQVLWKGARGKVGVVFTDQRVLAVSAQGNWQSEDRDLDERLPSRAILGDRVALVVTSKRALGFDGGSGNWVESRLGVRERVWTSEVGDNTAVVVTDRRALGLSPTAGGFFQTKLQLEERLEAVEASGNLVTLTTNRRLLIFRSPSGSWEERLRNLR